MKTFSPPFLCLVTALPCEARVFIDAYKLTLISRHPFALYLNSDRGIALVVSGIGFVRAMTALGVVFGRWSHPFLHFLNCGIAGSERDEVGSLFRIHKVSGGQGDFYPYLTRSNLPSRSLLTLEKPQSHYPADVLLDMEGAGFYGAAKQLVNRENIHLLKVVSDNASTGIAAVCKQQVLALFEQNFAAIDGFIQSLVNAARLEFELGCDPVGMSEILRKHRFSQYQQHQLRELLRRFSVNFPDRDVIDSCRDARDAGAVLVCLTDELQAVFGVMA